MFETLLTSHDFECRTPKGRSLFKSYDAALEFTENYTDELADIRAILLERTGHILDAAELHLTLKHVEEAARLLKLLLSQLWERLPVGSQCTDSGMATLARGLEKAASKIGTRLITGKEREEVRIL